MLLDDKLPASSVGNTVRHYAAGVLSYVHPERHEQVLRQWLSCRHEDEIDLLQDLLYRAEAEIGYDHEALGFDSRHEYDAVRDDLFTIEDEADLYAAYMWLFSDDATAAFEFIYENIAG